MRLSVIRYRRSLVMGFCDLRDYRHFYIVNIISIDKTYN